VRLLQLVDANMSLTTAYVPIRTGRAGAKEFAMKPARMLDTYMPELSVAAAWVVVMKLAYGLDGTPR
jgi:hypothetical protein